MRRILTTMPGGGVCINQPSSATFRFLTHGGVPNSYFGRALDRDWEIHKFVNGGVRESIAARWIDCYMHGGLTDAEAYELLADKDIPVNYTARELIEIADLPPDRWFRDAWRRSHNGGPVEIDIKRAMVVQARRIESENKRRAIEARKIETVDDLMRDPTVPPDVLANIVRALKRCNTLEAIRAVWPFETLH